MNDKGTIVQQLEDERNHLVAKIQKMQALLEWWVKAFEDPLIRQKLAQLTRLLLSDTKALLKEVKEVKDE